MRPAAIGQLALTYAIVAAFRLYGVAVADIYANVNHFLAAFAVLEYEVARTHGGFPGVAPVFAAHTVKPLGVGVALHPVLYVADVVYDEAGTVERIERPFFGLLHEICGAFIIDVAGFAPFYPCVGVAHAVNLLPLRTPDVHIPDMTFEVFYEACYSAHLRLPATARPNPIRAMDTAYARTEAPPVLGITTGFFAMGCSAGCAALK